MILTQQSTHFAGRNTQDSCDLNIELPDYFDPLCSVGIGSGQDGTWSIKIFVNLVLGCLLYSVDLNTDHLNTELFEVRFQMVGLCAMCYVLKWPFQYWTSTLENKIVSICPVFKWSACLVFLWHSNIGPFGIQPLWTIWMPKYIQIPLYYCYFGMLL